MKEQMLHWDADQVTIEKNDFRHFKLPEFENLFPVKQLKGQIDLLRIP